VSRRAPRHRKPPRYPWSFPARNARHRKPSPIASALQQQPARIAASAAASTLIITGVPAATHWTGPAIRPAALSQAHTFATLAAGPSPVDPTQQAEASHLTRAVPAPAASPPHARPASPPHARPASHRPPATAVSPGQAPAAPAYRNPFRDVSGLLPERVDQGVDFGGSGPVYALGDGIVTNATASNYGWPGGGWITYRLTDGPAAGLTVFLAEDVTPAVQVGQHVSSDTVIATMYDGGDGIETGWAQASGFTAESQLPEAGGISGYGPFPTVIGMNFEKLLQSLGVPPGNNATGAAYGTLPPGYPPDW
jgi:hypothetical protein